MSSLLFFSVCLGFFHHRIERNKKGDSPYFLSAFFLLLASHLKNSGTLRAFSIS